MREKRNKRVVFRERIECFKKKLPFARENWFCQITSYFAEITYYLRERFLEEETRFIYICCSTIVNCAMISS